MSWGTYFDSDNSYSLLSVILYFVVDKQWKVREITKHYLSQYDLLICFLLRLSSRDMDAI